MSSSMSYRLKHRADIRAVFAARCVARSESVRVHVRSRDDGEPARWTVVAGKSVGPAVERNRAKRRLRAVIASMELPPGADLIAVATPCVAGVSSAGLQRDTERAVTRAWTRATQSVVGASHRG